MEEAIRLIGNLMNVIGWSIAFAFLLLVFYFFVRHFLYICRPNEVLIFSGQQRRLADGSSVGYRVIFGGRAWRVPLIERVDRMDMTTIPIDITVSQAYSRGGIPLNVRAIANVKVSSDPVYIVNAIERFLGRDRDELRRVAKENLEGTLRGVLATLTPEEVNESRLKFAQSLAEDVEGDFKKLGLTLDTLKIQHVTDDTKYLESIGRSRIANVIKEAEIAESNANNEANKRAAEAKAKGEIARKDSERAIVQKRNDQRRIAAEMEAQAESELRRAKASAEKVKAESEMELQTIRRELEQLRLQADVVLPAEAGKHAREFIAKGDAAPIEENGKALALVLELLAKTWSEAGPYARDIFIIQQVEKLMGTVVDRLAALQIEQVHIIDPGDGSALPNYVASFPATVTSFLTAIKNSTGIDVPQLLLPREGSPADKNFSPLSGGPARSTTLSPTPSASGQ